MNKLAFISGVLTFVAGGVFFVSFFSGLGFRLARKLI